MIYDLITVCSQALLQYTLKKQSTAVKVFICHICVPKTVINTQGFVLSFFY